MEEVFSSEKKEKKHNTVGFLCHCLLSNVTDSCQIESVNHPSRDHLKILIRNFLQKIQTNIKYDILYAQVKQINKINKIKRIRFNRVKSNVYQVSKLKPNLKFQHSNTRILISKCSNNNNKN